MKVVVLCGGLSPERNVSISSGTKIAAALAERGHKVVQVDMFLGLEEYSGSLETIFDNPPALGNGTVAKKEPDLEAIKASRKWKSKSQIGLYVLEVCAMADIVFLALHGRTGEDGRIQATFDLMGIPYTGSGYLGSAIAMDKDLTKRFVAPFGVRTPAWQIVDCTQMDLDSVCAAAVLPCVIKPVDSGSSIGVIIAQDEKELRTALLDASKEGGRIVVEQYIAGREIQVAVLDGKPLPSIEIIPMDGFYDYANKYQPGAAKEITPAPISSAEERTVGEAAVKVFRALGLKAYSRADFILDESGEFWFLEINTLPGMTPTSLVPQEAAAAGISYGELCEKVIEIALRGA